MANLEVLFTRERYTAMINYLTYALPTTFSALIHQLTADQVKLYSGIDAPCCALPMIPGMHDTWHYMSRFTLFSMRD